ncbi:Eco57I restriction-modification methylase domain-containing protein [Capnocytophaga canimorsus]|uniref:Eco57I restriction-modification methylase domain-containing protein n=1 Tax=Capnocytophaga canimorsus TaxID=28188 RepID=UPI000F506FDD|nr:Eco57I restriction-modification methylase domain-containing protein [Capnocytophaga canimorsus]AYW36197.1 restriction endonuclease [Capnocytophaga canimorsus]
MNYNPDVLTCLANLSNDEVFTPPDIANQMLDTLPQELFSNPDAKFLDPFSKSGVFLREIAKRLLKGLQPQIPDLQERIDHIMHRQLYGIGITELTAYLSRRSLYCSTRANGKHSVTHFENENGNIYFKELLHSWDKNGKCTYCGATQKEFGEDQREGLSQHAYNFIHNDNPYQDMQFDVIIGNPPYQLSDGSGGSTDAAMPIYHKFIQQAIKLNPHYLCMIVPSKWMVGGRGLSKFRNEMMKEKRIKYLYDFENSSDCFSGIHLDGGVCYFLWDRDYKGKVDYTFQSLEGITSSIKKHLKNEYFDYVIRDNNILSIIEKVSSGEKFSKIVSSTMPYGIRKFLFNEPHRYANSNLQDTPFYKSVKIYGVKGLKGGARRVEGYISKDIIAKGIDTIDKYKLFFTTSYSTNAVHYPKVIVAKPNEICTETFLVIGSFENYKEQMNCLTYMETNFFKALLFFGKGTMQVSKSVFGLIPLQDFSKPWTDAELYAKYRLTEEEITYIEKIVRPME